MLGAEQFRHCVLPKRHLSWVWAFALNGPWLMIAEVNLSAFFVDKE